MTLIPAPAGTPDPAPAPAPTSADPDQLSDAEEQAVWDGASAAPSPAAPAATPAPGAPAATPATPADPAAQPVEPAPDSPRGRAAAYVKAHGTPQPAADPPPAPVALPPPAAAAPAPAAAPSAPQAPKTLAELSAQVKALPEERRRAPVPDQTDPNNAPMPLEEWVETWGATYLAMKEVERNLNLGAPPAPDPAMAEVQERFAAYDRSIAALTGELAAARMLRTLDRKHGVSDAEEILDDKFFAWADRQPPEVRQLADSDDPEAVALAVGIYREDAGLPPAEARAPRGPQPPRDSALHAGSLRAGGPVAPTPQSANGELTESEADELWKTTKVEG